MVCHFEIPRLKKFLHCFSLETGSLIIAWFYVIVSALELVTISVLYSSTLQYVEQLLSNYTETAEKQDAEMKVYLWKVVVDLTIVLLSFGVAINIFLLVGIYKRNYCLMLPWILLSGSGAVLGIFSGIVVLASSFYSLQLFMSAVMVNISIAMQVYFFLVVYSFYYQVKALRIMDENTPLSKAGLPYYHYNVLS